MKGWFSNLEILEIYEQINSETYQEDPKTRIETVNNEIREHSNQIESQSKRNRKTTHQNTEKCRNYKENDV